MMARIISRSLDRSLLYLGHIIFHHKVQKRKTAVCFSWIVPSSLLCHPIPYLQRQQTKVVNALAPNRTGIILAVDFLELKLLGKMPLASSRTASKAGECRRQSLPKTIDSSTKVSRSKAMQRRASLSKAKKQGQEERKGDKENQSNRLPPGAHGPTPYWKAVEERGGQTSPRLTRSAKKKKKNRLPLGTKKEENPSADDDRDCGVLLCFSPPNQQANAARERSELERKEQARDRRIAKARADGLAMSFSPTNEAEEGERDNEPEQFCLDLSASTNLTMEDASTSSSRNSRGSSKTTGVNSEQVVKELSSFKDTMNEALLEFLKVKASNDQSTAEAMQSEVHKMALDAQNMRCEELNQFNAKLEEKNQTMQSEIKELQGTLGSAKESYICEKTRLTSELDASKRESFVAIQGLDASKSSLEEKMEYANQEKSALMVRVKELEKDVAIVQEKLNDAQVKLEALRCGSQNDKSKLIIEMESLAKNNRKLLSDLEAAKQDTSNLEKKLAGCQEAIDTFETQLLPESEAQLEEAMEETRKQKEFTATVEKKLQESCDSIEALKSGINQMTENIDQERMQFEKVLEENKKTYDTLKGEDGTKRRKIDTLNGELLQVRSELSEEKERSQQAVEVSENLKEEMDQQIDELEAVIKEMQAKLEFSETTTQELEAKYAGAIDTIEKVSNAKEDALSSYSSTSASLEKLKSDLAAAQDRIHYLEEELRTRQIKISKLDHSLNQTSNERNDAQSRMQTFDVREEELFRKLRESDRIRRDLHNRVMQLSGNIRVYVRVRPPLPGEFEKCNAASTTAKDGKGKKRKHEETEDSEQLFKFPGVYDRKETDAQLSKTSADDLTKNLIEVTEPYKDRGGLTQRQKKWKFGFDNVFSPAHGQEDIWEATEPLVQSAIDGYNVCIFAYGQTGSGKTYTMLGESPNEGVIGRSVRKLFDTKQELEALSRGETKVEISVELLEVYNEQLRDLLAPSSGVNGKQVNLKLTSNEPVGNILVSTHSVADVMDVLELAQKRRCVKATMSNAESSRSHLVFTIHFQTKNKEGISRAGKLHVCDLAGSERLNKSGAADVGGSLLTETKHINTSLSCLSNVIEKLQSGDKVIPFRESKLTFLLQDSLGGNSKTLAIVCCNPLSSHFHESLCSLRFAAKVNKVDLKAVANFSC